MSEVIFRLVCGLRAKTSAAAGHEARPSDIFANLPQNSQKAQARVNFA